MKFHPHFLRAATLPIASLLLVIAAAALHPVCATELQAKSDAERYVLEQVQNGRDANLEAKFPPNTFPKDKRKLRASFIEQLLTNRGAHVKIPHGISIEQAVITGAFDLTGEEIPYDVVMVECAFEGDVDLTGSHFAKGLALAGSTFENSVDFSGATIGFDFIADACTFTSDRAMFRGMQVGRDFSIGYSTFGSRRTSFENMRVAGVFEASGSTFNSEEVTFDGIRIERRFSAWSCIFSYDQSAFGEREAATLVSSTEIEIPPESTQFSRVSFVGAHIADVFLNGSRFDKRAIVDLTRLQADLISFDHVEPSAQTEFRLDRMTFTLLSPADPERLQFLLSPYNAEFYSALENSFRTHGYADEADKIFIAKKRAERRENCKSFLHQCLRGAWALSVFEDLLAGYGKSLQNLLYWSVGFLIIGTFVFRSEKGMRTRDGKDAEQYEGKYQAFWYSLDLFLPVIKLGEADVWTPKDYRRWANLYRRVHIIIGSLFVPIGLAAWTGIIK